ncbi:MAG TPA: UDP-N-acetylglucosamine 2-epimerase (non-hydrolyzing) [Bacteroidales bacterium]|nr:UDP-N-acetylglucosamine 2-epimerase (non-hydrolyzing) [Bacteroidales bacterium]
MKIISVVGARPNFMKIAPFIKAINTYNERHTGNKPTPSPSREGNLKNSSIIQATGSINHILVHTGQHYDDSMSKAFFEQLEIPEADINLKIGSGTHAEQVGQTMIAFEKVLKAERPDWVVVVGDVNATLACSVTAKKEWIKVCHIEAGLRSNDLTMPEEINRLVTDRISDLLLAPDTLSVENLKAEGVTDSKIRFVGNIMIDTLEANREKAEKIDIGDIIKRNYKGSEKSAVMNLNPANHDFAVITLHRPSNVDSADVLGPIVDFLTDEVAGDLLLFWPIHPRTKKMLAEFGLSEKVAQHKNIVLLEPLGYLDMLRLNMGARLILTDSGGLQEECTVLGTPCLTLRRNTERPVTLRDHGGASVLVGNKIDVIREEYHNALQSMRTPVRPELWDGHAAERCLKAILEYGS